MLPALFGLADSSYPRDAIPAGHRKAFTGNRCHTDKPEVAQQISTAIIETAKAVTGKDDRHAVVAVKADSVAAAKRARHVGPYVRWVRQDGAVGTRALGR